MSDRCEQCGSDPCVLSDGMPPLVPIDASSDPSTDRSV